MTERIKFEKAANGMPKCPKCGKPMRWESDWNADEVLDIDEEELYPDEIVSLYSCPDCDKWISEPTSPSIGLQKPMVTQRQNGGGYDRNTHRRSR